MGVGGGGESILSTHKGWDGGRGERWRGVVEVGWGLQGWWRGGNPYF